MPRRAQIPRRAPLPLRTPAPTTRRWPTTTDPLVTKATPPTTRPTPRPAIKTAPTGASANGAGTANGPGNANSGASANGPGTANGRGHSGLGIAVGNGDGVADGQSKGASGGQDHGGQANGNAVGPSKIAAAPAGGRSRPVRARPTTTEGTSPATTMLCAGMPRTARPRRSVRHEATPVVTARTGHDAMNIVMPPHERRATAQSTTTSWSPSRCGDHREGLRTRSTGGSTHARESPDARQRLTKLRWRRPGVLSQACARFECSPPSVRSAHASATRSMPRRSAVSSRDTAVRRAEPTASHLPGTMNSQKFDG